MSINRYALLEGDQVVNVILWDDEEDSYEPHEGQVILPALEEINIGWARTNGEWVAPPVPELEAPPLEDPSVTEAKITGMNQLMALGITEPVARMIVGLPAK